MSEFLFFRSFFSPGEIQIFLVEIIIIRASIIGPCKEVSTTRKRRIPARCFISSARFSARDWFIYRDGRRACPSTTLDALRCWLIRLLSGSGGKEEASRRTAHSDPSFPVETPSTTLSGRKVSLSIQSRRSHPPNRPAYPQQDKFRSRILSGENFSEKRKRRKTIRYIIDRKFREKNYIYFGIGDIVNRNGIFGRIVWKDLERFGRSKSRVAGVCVDSRRKKFQDTRWIVAQCRRMVFSGVGARTCHITEWNLCPMPSGVTSCRWWTAPPRTLGPPSGYERRRTRPEEENPWFSLGPSLAFPPNFLELFLLLEL